MDANVNQPGGAVVPTLRYRDVAAAIDWLCNAFGFAQHLVVKGDDGAIRYAELVFGNGMIMLGPVEGSAFDGFMTQPEDNGGTETQICYLFIADAAAHCARAKAAGAEIVLDIEGEHGNGRGYSCRDLEGHVWNFGTYDPWKRQSAPVVGSSPSSDGMRGGLRQLGLVAGLVGVVAVSALLVGWALGVIDVDDLAIRTAVSTGVAEAAASPQQGQLAHERDARDAAERAIKAAKEQLAKERGEREAVERFARSARDQLGQERSAREAAERATKEIQAQLAREQSAREAAERAVRQTGDTAARADVERALADARQQLASERSALVEAQRIAQEARERLSLAEHASAAVQEQLAAERGAREAAELAALQVREQVAKERAAKDAAEKEKAAKEAREDEARVRAARRSSPPPRQRAVAQPSQPSGRPLINWDQ